MINSTAPVLFSSNKLRNETEIFNNLYSDIVPLEHSRIISNITIDNNIVAYLCVIEYKRTFEDYDK